MHWTPLYAVFKYVFFLGMMARNSCRHNHQCLPWHLVITDTDSKKNMGVREEAVGLELLVHKVVGRKPFYFSFLIVPSKMR